MPRKPRIIDEIMIAPSSLETIDQSVFNWIDKTLNISSTTNKGWKKVPVIWVSAERAYQIKAKKSLRDKHGVMIFPVITIERTAVVKDLGKKSIYWGNIPAGWGYNDHKGGSLMISTIPPRVAQEATSRRRKAEENRKVEGVGSMTKGTNQNYDKTDGLVLTPFGAPAGSKPIKKTRVVYQVVTVPMPVTIEVSYTIKLRTEYQQQLNELVAPFLNSGGTINYVPLIHNEHLYEGFLQSDYSAETNLASMGEELRKFETKIEFKVLGYILGDEQYKQPKIVIRESIVEVKFPRENIIFDTTPDWIDKYRHLFRE